MHPHAISVDSIKSPSVIFLYLKIRYIFPIASCNHIPPKIANTANKALLIQTGEEDSREITDNRGQNRCQT